MFVNCQPARRLCLPDLAPAQAIVRAGERRGDAELLPSRAVGLAVLSRLCFDSRSVFAFLSRRLSSVHACCLSCDKQDGLRYAPFLFRRVEIAIRAFSMRRCGYLTWRVHFGFGCFFVAIPTGLSGMRGTRNGVRENGGWRRGACASLRNRIGIVMLSAGSTLGLRAPNLRQRVFDSLDSPHAAAGLGWRVFAAQPTSLITGFCPRPHTGSGR